MSVTINGPVIRLHRAHLEALWAFVSTDDKQGHPDVLVDFERGHLIACDGSRLAAVIADRAPGTESIASPVMAIRSDDIEWILDKIRGPELVIELSVDDGGAALGFIRARFDRDRDVVRFWDVGTIQLVDPSHPLRREDVDAILEDVESLRREHAQRYGDAFVRLSRASIEDLALITAAAGERTVELYTCLHRVKYPKADGGAGEVVVATGQWRVVMAPCSRPDERKRA